MASDTPVRPPDCICCTNMSVPCFRQCGQCRTTVCKPCFGKLAPDGFEGHKDRKPSRKCPGCRAGLTKDVSWLCRPELEQGWLRDPCTLYPCWYTPLDPSKDLGCHELWPWAALGWHVRVCPWRPEAVAARREAADAETRFQAQLADVARALRPLQAERQVAEEMRARQERMVTRGLHPAPPQVAPPRRQQASEAEDPVRLAELTAADLEMELALAAARNPSGADLIRGTPDEEGYVAFSARFRDSVGVDAVEPRHAIHLTVGQPCPHCPAHVPVVTHDTPRTAHAPGCPCHDPATYLTLMMPSMVQLVGESELTRGTPPAEEDGYVMINARFRNGVGEPGPHLADQTVQPQPAVGAAELTAERLEELAADDLEAELALAAARNGNVEDNLPAAWVRDGGPLRVASLSRIVRVVVVGRMGSEADTILPRLGTELRSVLAELVHALVVRARIEAPNGRHRDEQAVIAQLIAHDDAWTRELEQGALGGPGRVSMLLQYIAAHRRGGIMAAPDLAERTGIFDNPGDVEDDLARGAPRRVDVFGGPDQRALDAELQRARAWFPLHEAVLLGPSPSVEAIEMLVQMERHLATTGLTLPVGVLPTSWVRRGEPLDPALCHAETLAALRTELGFFDADAPLPRDVGAGWAADVRVAFALRVLRRVRRAQAAAAVPDTASAASPPAPARRTMTLAEAQRRAHADMQHLLDPEYDARAVEEVGRAVNTRTRADFDRLFATTLVDPPQAPSAWVAQDDGLRARQNQTRFVTRLAGLERDDDDDDDDIPPLVDAPSRAVTLSSFIADMETQQRALRDADPEAYHRLSPADLWAGTTPEPGEVVSHERRVQLVLEQAPPGTTRAEAVAALERAGGDAVNAIMELSMGPETAATQRLPREEEEAQATAVMDPPAASDGLRVVTAGPITIHNVSRTLLPGSPFTMVVPGAGSPVVAEEEDGEHAATAPGPAEGILPLPLIPVAPSTGMTRSTRFSTSPVILENFDVADLRGLLSQRSGDAEDDLGVVAPGVSVTSARARWVAEGGSFDQDAWLTSAEAGAFMALFGPLSQGWETALHTAELRRYLLNTLIVLGPGATMVEARGLIDAAPAGSTMHALATALRPYERMTRWPTTIHYFEHEEAGVVRRQLRTHPSQRNVVVGTGEVSREDGLVPLGHPHVVAGPDTRLPPPSSSFMANVRAGLAQRRATAGDIHYSDSLSSSFLDNGDDDDIPPLVAAVPCWLCDSAMAHLAGCPGGDPVLIGPESPYAARQMRLLLDRISAAHHREVVDAVEHGLWSPLHDMVSLIVMLPPAAQCSTAQYRRVLAAMHDEPVRAARLVYDGLYLNKYCHVPMGMALDALVQTRGDMTAALARISAQGAAPASHSVD